MPAWFAFPLLLGLAVAQGTEHEPGPRTDDAEIRELLGQFAILDRETRLAAIDRVAKIGRRAVPHLRELIDDARLPAQVRIAALLALQSIGADAAGALPSLGRLLDDESHGIRGYALAAVAAVGAKARPLLDRVKARFKDQHPDVRKLSYFVATRLAEDRNDLLPAIATALRDDDAGVRAYLLRVLLQEYGAGAQALFDTVTALLADEHAEVRALAAQTLAAGGEPALPKLLALLPGRNPEHTAAILEAISAVRPVTAKQVEVLVAAFQSNDTGTRLVAGKGLVAIGEPAVGALAPLLDPPIANTRLALDTLQLLAAIGRPAASAAERLVALAGSPRTELRTEAIQTIGATRAATPRAIAVLAEAASGGDEPTRLAAVTAIGRLEDAAIPLIPRLVAALGEGDAQICQRVQTAFLSLGAHATVAVPGLLEMLDSDNPATSSWAIASLIAIGEPAVAPLILRLQDDASAATQCAILQALRGAGSVSAPAAPVLIEKLKSKHDIVRRDAALALARIGDSNAAPAVEALLDDPDRGVRLAAVTALGTLGREREGVVDRIAARLRDGDEGVRFAAIEALGWPDNRDAVKILSDLLASDDEFVRIRAARSLGEIGPAAAAAVPLLQRLQRSDRSPRVGTEATAALAKISGKK